MVDDSFDRAASLKKAIAVEFTDTSLRFMQLEGTHDQPKVRSFVEAMLPEGSVIDGVIQNAEAIGNLLLKALEQAEPKVPDTQYVISILPQRYVFQISIDLPNVEKEELRSLVSRQVEDLIPTPLTEVYWDWHRIGIVNNKIRIQIGAVSKSLVDSYMTVFNAAKLTPLSFEPGGSVVGRLLPKSDSIKEKMAESVEEKMITLHAEKDYVVICLLHERDLIFATELKVKWANQHDALQQISRKLAEVTQFSVLKSLGHSEDMPVVRLYGEPELVLMLENELPSVSRLEVSKFKFRASGHQVLEFLTKQSKDAFIELIGAALKGLPKYGELGSLNFVPDSAKQMFTRKELFRLLRNYLTVLALDIALVVLLLLVVSFRIEARRQDLELQLEAASALSNSNRIIAVKQAVSDLNVKTESLSALITKLYDWQKFTDMLAASTPSEIVLSTVTVQPISDGSLSDHWRVGITGVGSNREVVLGYLDTLRLTGLLTNVKLPLESLEESANVLFNIEADLPFVNLLPNETD